MQVCGWVRHGAVTAAMLVVAAVPTLDAQATDREDAHWLNDCRSERGWHRHERFCELRVQHLGRPTDALRVDGQENGGVEVTGWDRDSVELHALIDVEAASDDEARDIASKVSIVTGNGSIHADGPGRFHRNSWTVSYRIYVPRHSNLALTTINGPVSVEGVTGRMDLRATNGPIGLERVGGDVHARAENGPLDVTLDGTRWNGTGLDAETENGPVELTLPKEYAAHLETGTENGPMEVNFPMTVQGHVDLRHLTLDIGGGGPTVRVVTTNGPVSVRKE